MLRIRGARPPVRLNSDCTESDCLTACLIAVLDAAVLPVLYHDAQDRLGGPV